MSMLDGDASPVHAERGSATTVGSAIATAARRDGKACLCCGKPFKHKVSGQRIRCVSCNLARAKDYKRVWNAKKRADPVWCEDRRAKGVARLRSMGVPSKAECVAQARMRADALLPQINALRSQGLTYLEIGARLCLSRGAVAGLINRAKKPNASRGYAIGEGADAPSRQSLQATEATHEHA